MSSRFETSLENYLAAILEQELYRRLEMAGFRETLRLAEPHLAEFERDSDLLTVQVEQAGSHRRSVSVESESTDVYPLVGFAARDVILETCDQLLAALPWVDRAAVRERVESCLADLVADPGE